MKIWKCRVLIGTNGWTLHVQAESHKQAVKKLTRYSEKVNQGNGSIYHPFLTFCLKKYGLTKIVSIKSVEIPEYIKIDI